MKIAIDLGRYSTQAIANSQQVSFPSVLGEGKDLGPFSANNNLTLNVLGKNWFVGDTALEQSTFTRSRGEKDWVQSDRFLVLALAAINQLIKVDVDVELITGLPHSNFKNYRTAMQSRLEGDYIINGYQKVNIHTVTVLTQSIAGIIDYVSDNHGNYIEDRARDKLIGCINVGSHTVEVGTAQFKTINGAIRPSYVSNRCQSLEDGIWKMVDELKPRLAEELPTAYDEYELDQILRTGKAMSRGEKDVTHITGPVIREYFESLADECRNIWTDQQERYSLDKFHTIVCVGGKGFEFGTYLLNKGFHPNIHLPRDGQWATVRGYQKFGMR